jgi:predicted negative regulator of RcsB-dependent stress response
MVAVLSVPLMLGYDRSVVEVVNKWHNTPETMAAVKELPTDGGNMTIRLLVIFATLTVIGWAIWQSKRATPIAK